MRRIRVGLAAAVWVMTMAGGIVYAGAASISERDDFYHAVNAETLETKQIEPTEPSWSWFSERSLENTKILEGEIQGIAAKAGTYEKGTPEQKIADLYGCAVDMDRRNATARQHIDAVIEPLKNAGTLQELTQALMTIHNTYAGSVFVDYTVSRLPDQQQYAVRIVPAETILTKYELEAEPHSGAWQAYKKYIADVLAESGQDPEEAMVQAEAVFSMEQGWAQSMLTSEEENDVAVENRMARREDVEKLMENMDGKAIFASWGLDGEKQVFLSAPDYLRRMDEDYVQENLPVLKSYAVFRIMNSYAPYADSKLRDLQRQYTLQRFGIRQLRSDEETASRMVQNLLAYDCGQIYLKEHCSAEAIEDVAAMIDKVRSVYRKRLEANDWLDEETKKEAVGKLDSLRVFIGGPSENDRPVIEAMTDVISEKDGGDLLGNIIHNAVLAQEQMKKLLGTDFDPDKWYAFQPQDVNAAYIGENNSITIPAGILQAPFYSPDASPGENLGGIGVVIGHEISHAFDPNGSQYDKDGRMNNWWTAADYQAFQKKSGAFGPYYDRYEVGEGLYENGKLVANEAIADCGGLSVVTEIAGGDSAVLRDIYRNFAVIFAQKMTPQLLLKIVQNDPHPVGPARVNSALSSTDAFYDAYGIEEGDGMYVSPEARVNLW